MTLTPNDPACVSVPIINDSVFEETESLTVSLSMIGILSSAVHFPSDVTTLFINDDDGKYGCRHRLVHVYTTEYVVHTLYVHFLVYVYASCIYIRESVDSLCIGMARTHASRNIGLQTHRSLCFKPFKVSHRAPGALL